MSFDGVGVIGVVETAGGGQGHKSFGVEGQARDPNGAGGSFYNSAPDGPAIGVSALTEATTGRAVYGVAVMPSQTATGFGNDLSVGVWGDTGARPGASIGVLGTADDGVAVGGQSNSSTLAAGDFENTATSGSNFGVVGKSSSPSGMGVYGAASATTGGANGVVGTTASPYGYGVWGISSATSGHAYGVYGQSNTGAGVTGTSSGDSGAGVSAFNTNTSSGEAQALYAVASSSNAAAGFFTNTGGGYILIGTDSTGAHLFTVDASGDGYFAGNLNVGGTLTKGGGSFKIDHPLDPANKYLSHSFVESPDMMNIYNGNVTTDRRGRRRVVAAGLVRGAQSGFPLSAHRDRPVRPSHHCQGNQSRTASRLGPTSRSEGFLAGHRHPAGCLGQRAPHSE